MKMPAVLYLADMPLPSFYGMKKEERGQIGLLWRYTSWQAAISTHPSLDLLGIEYQIASTTVFNWHGKRRHADSKRD